MEITIGHSSELIEKAQALRYQVFTVEQKIPRELDLDGLDDESTHALVTEQGIPVATARLTINDKGFSVMARVAVVEACRGLGVASKIIKALMEYARKVDVSSIEIHAHGHLRNYYENFGFEFMREVEIVGEHQLIEMQYQIVRT